MNIRINTQHRFTVSKMPFYRLRKAVSLVVKRPFTTSALKVYIHSIYYKRFNVLLSAFQKNGVLNSNGRHFVAKQRVFLCFLPFFLVV